MSRIRSSDNEVYVYDSADQLMGYGGVTKRSPLSNFYKSEFDCFGQTFLCAEMAIMYLKAITFGDQTVANSLLSCTQPSSAKRLGRQVKPFDPNVWVETRNEKVPQILYSKFTQNPELKNWLLSTGNAVLAEIAIEDNNGRVRYTDRIWGITIGAHHKHINRPDEWHKYGQNFLGKTLMSVRQTIVDEMKPK